ncbi:unnamed protein product, partial [Mesorhabditis spiculigera]
MPEQEEPTYACRVCGRRFIRTSLDKHEPVCKKLNNLNRKVFDSGKQRATGSDISINDVRRAQKEKEKAGGQFSRPKTQWRERHQDFQEAISASKKTGAPLPPPPKTSVPSDYVQCEYCGRNFNERAAERHVPFCREQQTRKGPLKPKTREGRNDMRTRSQSRTRDESRRKSHEDRPPRTSNIRPTANSAGVRDIPPVTPNRRSNSAPRTPAQPSRLKAPISNIDLLAQDQATNTPLRGHPENANRRKPRKPVMAGHQRHGTVGRHETEQRGMVAEQETGRRLGIRPEHGTRQDTVPGRRMVR